MARQVTPLKLDAASYPFLMSDMARTIFLKDGNESGSVNYSQQQDSDIPKNPQAFYMENMVPLTDGLTTVGYLDTVDAISGVTDIKYVRTVRIESSDILRVAYSFANKRIYIRRPGRTAWEGVSLPTGFADLLTKDTTLTTGFAQGAAYLYLSNVGCMKLVLDSATDTYSLSTVLLGGITPTTINGCSASSNYLILWDDSSVYWSSVIDPTDFVPSLSTGADSQNITDLKGGIIFIAQMSQGFMIYSQANIVAAGYTNNIRFPWNFREVPGSAGISDPEQVTWEDNFSDHVAWTSAGLQKISKSEAKLMFENVTDFLTGRIKESYDFDTGKVTRTKLLGNYRIKVAVIGSRFLAVSYGVTSLTDILIYDYGLTRWGHLKIDHVDVFELTENDWEGVKTYQGLGNTSVSTVGNVSYADLVDQPLESGIPKFNFGIIDNTGKIVVVDMSKGNKTNVGTIMFGRLQYTRVRKMKLLRVEVSGVTDKTDYECKIYSTNKGVGVEAVTIPDTEMVSYDDLYYMDHHCYVSATSHIIALRGRITVTGLLITHTLGGQPQQRR